MVVPDDSVKTEIVYQKQNIKIRIEIPQPESIVHSSNISILSGIPDKKKLQSGYKPD